MNDLLIAYFLIALGLVLMAAEVLLPGGVLVVLGAGALIVALAMIFHYDIEQGVITVLALLIVVPLGGPVLLHYWPRTAVGRQLVLAPDDQDATVAAMPVHVELEQLRGRYGRTVSALRPAGVTEFDGRRVDTLSEGPLIEAGTWVICTDVQAGKVIVRKVAAPPPLGSFDFDDWT